MECEGDVLLFCVGDVKSSAACMVAARPGQRLGLIHTNDASARDSISPARSNPFTMGSGSMPPCPAAVGKIERK